MAKVVDITIYKLQANEAYLNGTVLKTVEYSRLDTKDNRDKGYTVLHGADHTKVTDPEFKADSDKKIAMPKSTIVAAVDYEDILNPVDDFDGEVLDIAGLSYPTQVLIVNKI